MSEQKRSEVSKGQIRDLNSRTVFKEPILCAQFLRDYTGISLLKNVQPDDIEDVSEKYQAYLGIAFETDTVTKVRIRGKEDAAPIFLVSLVEHKSQVDYDVAMQLLRYMVCIWTEYAKEMQKNNEGYKGTKTFKYPPILPIVYYEGNGAWTAELHLKDRIMLSKVFGDYIPDFTYKLVSNRDYSNEELLENRDEMSLLMTINKVQTPEALTEFLNIQQEKIQEIIKNAPHNIVEIITSVIWSLCMKMNVPQDEAKQCVEKVRECRMGYWFENVKMDIQAERKEAEEARKEAEMAQKDLEMAQKDLEMARKEVEEIHKEIEEIHKEIEAISEERIEEKYETIINISREFDCSKETIVTKLMEKCNISRELAEEKLVRYWNE